MFLVVLAAYPAISGNDESRPVQRNNLTLQTGFDQFQDHNLHPKVFRGLMLGVAFSHQRTDVRITFLEIGLKTSFINTDYEEFPSALSFRLHGNFGYLFPVYSNARFDVFLGSVSDLQFGTNMYFNWDESHLYYANYLSEGIGGRLIFRKERNHFEFELDVPLLSLISRPEMDRQYKIDDISFGGIMKNLYSNPELVLPNHHFFVRTGVEYKYQTGKSKERSWGYQVRYHFMQSKCGEPFRGVEQKVTYKIFF
jgi:hypothetical protein